MAFKTTWARLMRPVIIKVYAWLSPANQALFNLIDIFLSSNYIHAEQELQNDLLTLNYEGEFFALEEFIDLIQKSINQNTQGKIDYIDLENWSLSRYLINNGTISSNMVNLDNAIKIHETDYEKRK